MSKLFPHILVRVANSPMGTLQKLEWSDWSVYDERLRAMEKEHALEKEKFCQWLYDRIRQSEDPKMQNLLLETRRNVFNNRYARIGRLISAGTLTGAELPERLTNFFRQQEAIGERRLEWSDLYARETNRIKLLFRETVQEELFLKGLAFASEDLPDHLPLLKRKLPMEYGSKELDMELSLLKYVARMAGKTSPFSTFTSIVQGGIGCHPSTPILVRAPATGKEVRGYVRINSQIFKGLKHVLENYPTIYYHLPVRLNPTSVQTETGYNFLVCRNNMDTFQRLDRTDELVWITDVFTNNREDRSFVWLLELLKEDTGATGSEAERYIRRLLKIGFIEYDYPVSGTDPDWDLKLVEWLSGITDKDELTEDLIEELCFLRRTADRLAASVSGERKGLMKEAHRRFSSIYNRIANDIVHQRKMPEMTGFGGEALVKEMMKKTDYFTLGTGKLFYEDTVRDMRLSYDGQKLDTVVGKLDELLGKLHLFDTQNDERRKLTAYFRMTYGAGGEVDFLTFYEEYYRNFQKEEDRRKSTPDAVDAEHPFALYFKQQQEARNAKRDMWQQKFLEELGDFDFFTEQVDIRSGALDVLNKELAGEPESEEKTSNSAFMQLFVDGSEDVCRLKGVVNGLIQGNGKMFSRFLHLLDDRFTTDLRVANAGTAGDNVLPVENTDGAWHNSNMHPPVFDWELCAPGGHNSLPPQAQIRVSDLLVTLGKDSQYVTLLHKGTRKRCNLYDVGFLGLNGRSKMFQLLNQFTPSGNFNLSAVVIPILRKLDTRARENPDILNGYIVFPRIVYEGDLILRRRTWNIRVSILPVRVGADSDADYFLKVNRWRRRLQLPDELFLFANPSRFKNYDGEAARYGKDDHKPQFISFNSPLLVSLWEKTTRKSLSFIRVEEALPGREQLLSSNGENWVSECAVQWERGGVKSNTA